MPTYTHRLMTPIGEIVLSSDGDRLTGLAFDAGPPPPNAIADPAVFRRIVEQLQAYFAGELRWFQIPIAWSGPAFSERVWHELTQIEYGTVASYATVAARVGQPNATRAVGQANRRNPIAIVVPCHRVIAADGTLGGYSGGLPRKEWLLQHECGTVPRRRRQSPGSRNAATTRRGSASEAKF